MQIPRTLISLLLVAFAGVALAACGSGGDDAAATPGKSSEGAFPARVAHAFGTTTVPREPERIVVVGLTEHDTVLALGKKPVGVTEWYGEQPSATWPWARRLLGSAKPTVLKTTDGIEFEKVASLRPDLIIGTNAGLERKDFDRLSRIAPTIAGPEGGTKYFAQWDRQVELVAQALGRPDEGERLVREVKEGFARAAAEHPEFRGKTVTFSQNGFYDGQIYVYPEGLNTEFLTYLGLEMNPQITRLAKKRGEQVGISPERLDVLEADAVVFATEKPADITALKKVPTFDDLPAVRERRAVYTDGTLAGAMYFMTPLSLRYVLERLPDQIEAALAGRAPQRLAGGA